MDIGTKTRCFRQSKRHDLLTGQWEQKRYKQHRDRITNAEPRIDVKTPTSDSFQHVKVCSAHNKSVISITLFFAQYSCVVYIYLSNIDISSDKYRDTRFHLEAVCTFKLIACIFFCQK